ncbi:MAG: hypothetical protein ACXWM6_16090, partial [Thermodesulfobacteriota bacterium]
MAIVHTGNRNRAMLLAVEPPCVGTNTAAGDTYSRHASTPMAIRCSGRIIPVISIPRYSSFTGIGGRGVSTEAAIFA